MDIQALSATQMANVIRLEVFMDNHQTQGYLMKTITKLLVQLEVTKMQNQFKHTNAEMYREQVDRHRARSMPYVNDDMSFQPVPKTRSSNTIDRRNDHHEVDRHDIYLSERRDSLNSRQTSQTDRSHRSSRSKLSFILFVAAKMEFLEDSQVYPIP